MRVIFLLTAFCFLLTSLFSETEETNSSNTPSPLEITLPAQNQPNQLITLLFSYGPITNEDDATYSNSNLEEFGYEQSINFYPVHETTKKQTDQAILKNLLEKININENLESEEFETSVMSENLQDSYFELLLENEQLSIRQRYYVINQVIYQLEQKSLPGKLPDTEQEWISFTDSFSVRHSDENSQTASPYENWMSQLPAEIQNRRIDQILLPGTHDSAAYRLDFRHTILDSGTTKTLYYLMRMSKSIRTYVKKWFLTQSNDLYMQLNQGIRFLDLRVSYNPTNQRFYLTHLFSAVTLEEGLSQIAKWVEEHPTEAIVITMKPDSSHSKGMKERTEALVSEITGKLETYLYPHEDDGLIQDTMTLADMIQKRKNILFYLRSKDPVSTPLIWRGNGNIEIWKDSSSVTVRLRYLLKNLLILENEPKGRYHFASAALTPQVCDVVKGIANLALPGETKESNLATFAKKMKNHFKGFFETNEEAFHAVSAVMVDFPDEEFIRMIVEYNQRLEKVDQK